MNPYLLTLIVVVNAAVFTHFDAARIRESHHVGVGPRGIAPHAWAALVFLFLPLALPYYLYIRGTATAAATREGPPPQFTARDLNVWGYVSAVVFLAAAVYLGLVGQFSWAALAGLAMAAGLFGGRKAVQVGEGEREFDLGGAAWDMSGFRPVDDDEMDDDDQKDLVAPASGAFIPPAAGPRGDVKPAVAASDEAEARGGAGVDVFSPPKQPGVPPTPPAQRPARPIVADAAPPLAMAAFEDDDENVWDPLRADEEAQRAREGSESKSPTPQSPTPQSQASPAPPPPAQPPHSQPAQPSPATSRPAAPDPAAPTPSPAQTQPLSALPDPPPAPPSQKAQPAHSPQPQSPPAMDLGEELPPGLVDDEEVSLVDDDLAPFELAPDEDDEVELPEAAVDDEDDEDLELLAPLPPLPPIASVGRRPAPPRSAAQAPAAPAGGSPGSAVPADKMAAEGIAAARDRSRSRPSAPPVGGYVGQAQSSGPPAVLIWFVVIAAILGVAWWLGSRDDGAVDPVADGSPALGTPADDASETAADASPPTIRRAEAAEEAMRRQMNGWISTYDTVMRPIAELVEEIDFGELRQGSCLELQRQAEKADRQLKTAPDEEVELLLRPAFDAFLSAGLACSGGDEMEWSVHLLQAKDHTHETQILLDERYRYVGPFELEQEEALGHQRSLETISGRYLAGQLEAQQPDD